MATRTTRRQPPAVQPLESTSYRDKEKQKSVQVNNAQDWVTFFKLACPPSASTQRNVRQACRIKAYIPHTILLSCSGVPNLWYYSCPNKTIRLKAPKNLVLSIIFAKLIDVWKKTNDSSRKVAIARFGFATRLLDLRELENLRETLSRPHLTDRDSSDFSTFPFCLQQYIEPRNGLRYVAIYSRTEKAETWDVLPLPFHKRYTSMPVAVPPKQAAAKAGGPPSPRRQAVLAVQLQRPEVERYEKAKIENSLKNIASQFNQRDKNRCLSGLVCEYVICADTNDIYLTSILGLTWMGERPSWEARLAVDSESKLIHTRLQQLEEVDDDSDSESICSVPEIRPSVFPNLNSVAAFESGNVHISSDNIKFSNANIPLLFRNGRFISPLSAEQTESVCRLHAAPDLDRKID